MLAIPFLLVVLRQPTFVPLIDFQFLHQLQHLLQVHFKSEHQATSFPTFRHWHPFQLLNLFKNSAVMKFAGVTCFQDQISFAMVQF